MDIDSDDECLALKRRRLSTRRHDEAMEEKATQIRRLQQQVAKYQSRAEIAEELLEKRKEIDEDVDTSVSRHQADRDAEKRARKQAVRDSEAMSELLVRHAAGSLPERIKGLRDTNSFTGSEMRSIEGEIWRAMLRRLREGPHGEELYSLSAHSVDGERIVQHRKDILLANHEPDHWLPQELRRQIIEMVVEAGYRCRLAAPWHLTEDGQHALWWWHHPSRGLLQSDLLGVEAAFKLVHANIVRHFATHPSFKTSDKFGDAFLRDHAAAVDRVMSALQIEDVADEVKAGLAARHL